MIPRLAVAAILLLQAIRGAEPIRPLAAGLPIHDTLAGGGRAVFSVDVPANTAARVVLDQQGVDLAITLRRQGSALPEHGLDLTAGIDGQEVSYPAIGDADATWTLTISTALPRAARGDYTIALELQPADDRNRAIAIARAKYHAASDTAWGGDAKAFQQAVVEYAAAADAAQAAGDMAVAAEATYQWARVRDNLGDAPGAIELQRRALTMFREIGRRDREARVLNRLGDLSRKVGEVTASESYFSQALPLARDAHDPANVADILNNSGLLMLTLGRFEEARDQLQSAIPLAQEVNSASVETALNNNMGDAYTSLGLYDQAIAAYRRALVVVVRLNLPRRTARTHFMMATAQFEQGDRAGAEAGVHEALALYEAGGDRAGLAEVLAFSGRLQREEGHPDQAVELFGRALPLLHEQQNRLAETRVLSTWAEIDVDRGDVDAALPRVTEALRLARLLANPEAEQRALYVQARAQQRAGRLDEAIASIAEATRSVEDMRGRIARSELRGSYLATVRSYFDLRVDLLQQRGRTADAFAVSEGSRARTLLEGLAESRSKISKGVDPQLLARQRSVQAELNARETYRAQVALKDGDKSPRALAVGKDIDRLLEDLSQVRAAIRAVSPAYWDLQAPEPISAAQVQASLLDGGSALVEYHLGPRHSYAWVIDRGAITVSELPGSAAIEAIARRYHEQLSRETDGLTPAARATLSASIGTLGARLAAAVWKPIEPRVRGKRLLIVADGVLQYVPFAALPAATGQPLIVSHEIVYLPSAAVLASIRAHSRPVQPAAATAVFADPVFSKNDPRFAGERDDSAPARTRAADGGSYARLRFSRAEATAIGAVAPGVFEALDFTASKQTLAARDLRRFRILHFATHGSLNAEHPELSGLVLSLVDASGKPVDGFLRLHEIYNLDLDADLVVLSACSTALGKEVNGEGLIGLTRGFMYAGASRVVSSVWNVDDRASARLMAGFYTAMLARGHSPASALREAQLSLLRDPRWANPHYWAAFGLQGEWK